MPKLSHENSINLLFLYLFFNTDNGNILLRRERKLSGLVERPGSTYWRVRHPLFSCNKWRGMKELSIFVDESADFGEYDPHSYISIIVEKSKALKALTLLMSIIIVVAPLYILDFQKLTGER